MKHDAGRIVSGAFGEAALAAAGALSRVGRHRQAFRLRSLAFRFDWGRAGTSVACAIKACLDTRQVGPERVTGALREVLEAAITSTGPLPHTAKFFDDPCELFEGVLVVLAEARPKRRGVILVKYSYYFLLLERFFDVDALQKDYWLVVEPSWNGYCDESILCFLRYREPVFVLTPNGTTNGFSSTWTRTSSSCRSDRTPSSIIASSHPMPTLHLNAIWSWWLAGRASSGMRRCSPRSQHFASGDAS